MFTDFGGNSQKTDACRSWGSVPELCGQKCKLAEDCFLILLETGDLLFHLGDSCVPQADLFIKIICLHGQGGWRLGFLLNGNSWLNAFFLAGRDDFPGDRIDFPYNPAMGPGLLFLFVPLGFRFDDIRDAYFLIRLSYNSQVNLLLTVLLFITYRYGFSNRTIIFSSLL